MREAKNTPRATVHIGYTGKVFKTFKGPQARERYENEVRVLEFLEKNDCPFVPRVLEKDDDRLHLVMSNCGSRVEHLNQAKVEEIFARLEQFGVRHDDIALRNITYNPRSGEFCVIDFEFATILVPGYPPPPDLIAHPNRDLWDDGAQS